MVCAVDNAHSLLYVVGCFFGGISVFWIVTSVVPLELPVVVRCAYALSYVILLKLVGRGYVAGLEVLWKSRLRFLDERHLNLAFCCGFDSPLNRVAAQIGRAELHWECLKGP